jgi:hypothetical protein
MMTNTYRFFDVKRAKLLLALGAFIAALVLPAMASAWYDYSAWTGNRTYTTASVYWTVRAQEDAPYTGADQVMVCWTPTDSSYYNPCDHNKVTFAQYASPGETRGYTIGGLDIHTSLRVTVAQSYVLQASGDWHSKSLSVAPYCHP